MKKNKKLKAIDYIRKGWTKRYYACTKSGAACLVTDKCAVRWCASGAIHRAYSNIRICGIKFRKLRDILGPISIVDWNDDPKRTKKQVLAAFEKAGI